MQVVMDFYYSKLTLVKCLEIYHIESCYSNLRFGVCQGFPSIVVLRRDRGLDHLGQPRLGGYHDNSCRLQQAEILLPYTCTRVIREPEWALQSQKIGLNFSSVDLCIAKLYIF